MRWAVLNSVALLRTHEKAHSALAEAMQRGESVRLRKRVKLAWPGPAHDDSVEDLVHVHIVAPCASGGGVHSAAREHARQLRVATGRRQEVACRPLCGYQMVLRVSAC